MFELIVIQSDFMEPLNVVAIDVIQRGQIDGTLIERVIVEKDDLTQRYLIKANMMIDGPTFRRPKDVLYLA